MAEGKVTEAWNHTAHVMTLLANLNRDPKKTKPFEPSQFHPYARQPAQEITVDQLTREILMTVKAKQRKP